MYRRSFIVILLTVFVSGCITHTIKMSPELGRIRIVETDKKIHKKVAYYISKADRQQTITQEAAAGESISYKPYADSEAALNTVLSKIFDRVYSLKSLDDKEYIQNKGIEYIFIPKIQSLSQSGNLLSWVPTLFTVNLSCKATDSQGKQIWDKRVKGIGSAMFSEISGGNFSLAAERATARAYVLLMKEITKAEEF